MDRREAFAATVAHREPERVLVDYGKHIGSFHRLAYDRLRKHAPDLRLPEHAEILDRMAQNVVLPESLCRRLGLDFRWLVPHWVGVQDIEIDGEPGYLDMWCTPHKWTEVGSYFAVAGQPLGRDGLTVQDIAAFGWPDPDQPAMFAGLAEQARHLRENTDYVIGADGIKVGILQTASQLRGYDKLFTDFALDPELAHALLSRLSTTINEMYGRYMAAVGRYVQVVVITDDQGTQKSLMVSPRMFRTFIKPYLRSLIETIKGAADVKVLMHCDGAIVPILPDLIEIGVDIINPVQTVVSGLEDTHALKETFGEQITFHGGLDVQQVVPNATPAGLRAEVGRRIYDLGRGGGYILAPCHNISFDVPPANVLALFDAAADLGRYPLQAPAGTSARDARSSVSAIVRETRGSRMNDPNLGGLDWTRTAATPPIVRFKELTRPENAVPLMFIDSVLPGHERMNWAVIGDTASENPDFKPAITTPHRFQIGVFMCPPGSGPAWHRHDYIELFLPLGGRWRFHWGSDEHGAEDGHADLDPFDIISLPPGTWRAFENISDGPAFCFAVLESHEAFAGKDPYWGTQVIERAADLGFRASDKGEMIKPDNYVAIEQQVTSRLVGWLNRARRE